jgi:hypothetical protein
MWGFEIVFSRNCVTLCVSYFLNLQTLFARKQSTARLKISATVQR